MRVWLFAPFRDKVTSSACSTGCSPQAEDQVCIEMIAQARQVWVRPFTRPGASISLNETLWNVRAASFRLDVGSPDHLGPLLGVVGDEPAEIGGRAGKQRAAELEQPRLELRILERCV